MIIDEVKKIILKLNELDDLYEDLPKQLSEVDTKICDILHLIESNNLKTNECYRIIRELKKQRMKRRQIKNNYTILQVFNTHINKLPLEENRSFLLNEINKKNKEINSEYKNRIYTSEEIDNILKGV